MDAALNDHPAQKINREFDEIGGACLSGTSPWFALVTKRSHGGECGRIRFLNGGLQSLIGARRYHDLHPAIQEISLKTGIPQEVKHLLKAPVISTFVIGDSIEVSLIPRHDFPDRRDEQTVLGRKVVCLGAAGDTCALADFLSAGLSPAFLCNEVKRGLKQAGAHSVRPLFLRRAFCLDRFDHALRILIDLP